jgi:hypothetical protein
VAEIREQVVVEQARVEEERVLRLAARPAAIEPLHGELLEDRDVLGPQDLLP